MIAALSGKIANLREMITDGTIGKIHRLITMTNDIKIGSHDPETERPNGTQTNMIAPITNDNMDTTEFLETSWFSFAADLYLDDFSPTIVHNHHTTRSIKPASTIALLVNGSQTPLSRFWDHKGPRELI